MDNLKDLKIIEAILFSSSNPVLENDLKEKIFSKDKIKILLEQLKNFYSDRGINLIKTGNSWSFRTSPDLIDKLTIFKEQKRRISRAAIETLAIIAYYQPITRAEIENIRGVQMGRGSIDHLMEIGWIKPKGRKNGPGRPTTWVTTETFLEHLKEINNSIAHDSGQAKENMLLKIGLSSEDYQHTKHDEYMRKIVLARLTQPNNGTSLIIENEISRAHLSQEIYTNNINAAYIV